MVKSERATAPESKT